jgi:hypothetical protein
MRHGLTYNYAGALAFLRSLIYETPTVVEDSEILDGGEGVDPGWCVSEHAFAAQIALRAAGVHARLGIGAALYLDRRVRKLSFQLLDHRYILLGTDRDEMAVFDSAVHVPGTDGIAPDFHQRNRALTLVLVGGIPDQAAIAGIKRDNQGPQLLCYVLTGVVPLEEGKTSFAMSGDFGAWLENTFGDQELLWGKAIGMTVRILEHKAPTIPVEVTPENQSELWEWLSSRPDERDFIHKRIWRS